MNKLIILSFLGFAGFSWAADPIAGKWQTIDDKTGQPKAVVNIYENGGQFYGKIESTKIGADEVDHCRKCTGKLKDKPLVGLPIVYNLKKSNTDKKYEGGKILDPKSGSLYKLNAELKDNDTLTIRGYIGVSALGRNQTWKRIK